MKRRLLVAALLLAPGTVACGALLGFPDETKEDPNFGQVDGSLPDGAKPDGALPDGQGPGDTSIPLDAPVVDPDGGCNCFGGTCNGGVCQPVAIAQGLVDPKFIDTDGTSVFFSTGATAIYAVNPSAVDAGAKQITNVAEPNINDLRAQAGFVYFANAGGGANNNSISRCPLSGCGDGGRVEYSTSSRKNYSVAVDSTNVYYTVNAAQGSSGGVWACPQTGCSGGTRIFPRDFPGVLAAGSTTLAWFEGASGSGVVQGSKLGSGSVSAGDTGIVDVTYAPNGDIYYVKQSSVWRQVGQAAATQIAAASNAVSIQVDAANVYWIDRGTASLMRCPIGANCTLSQSMPVQIASGLQLPFDLALGVDSIYFTTEGDGKVWRLRK